MAITWYSVANLNMTGVCIQRLSNGTIYLFGEYSAVNEYQYRAYKSTDGGQNWTYLTYFSIVQYYGVEFSACVDGNDNIHVLMTEQYQGSGYAFSFIYYPFNTSTDTYGTPENMPLSGVPTGGYSRIAVDSNNYPHAIFSDRLSSMGNSYMQVRYSNRTSGSWSNAITLNSSATTDYYPYELKIHGTTVEAVYFSSGGGYYKTRTGTSWGSEGTISTTGSNTNTGNRGAVQWDGSTVYRMTGGGYSTNFYENGTSVLTPDATGLEAWFPTHGTTRTIYWRDASSVIRVSKNTGSGWGTQVNLGTVTGFTAMEYYTGNVDNSIANTFGAAYTTVSATYYAEMPTENVGSSSVSPSVSPSASVSPSSSVSASTSPSVSPSSSSSVSPSASSSLSPSASASPSSAGQSSSVSPSLSPSASVSPSISPSASASLSPSSSESRSISPSASESRSLSPSSSQSASLSPSSSESSSPSPSTAVGYPFKRWNNDQWVKAILKVYLGGTWQTKPLKIYLNGNWEDVDTNG